MGAAGSRFMIFKVRERPRIPILSNRRATSSLSWNMNAWACSLFSNRIPYYICLSDSCIPQIAWRLTLISALTLRRGLSDSSFFLHTPRITSYKSAPALAPSASHSTARGFFASSPSVAAPNRSSARVRAASPNPCSSSMHRCSMCRCKSARCK